MTFKEFIKSKYFFIQLGLAAILFVIILWLSLRFLDLYTLHGHSIEVPDLEDLKKEEAITIINDLNLNYTIRDSIYDQDREKGSIAAQDPLPGNEVKRGRNIYLTMVATMPEKVTMPDLTDLSLRQAISILNNHGLKVGELKHVHHIAKNAVVDQKFKDGTINPGTLVEKGTHIDLILGKGLSESETPTPFVIGKTREEALMEINRASLNIGKEEYLDDDSTNVRVYKQNPGVIEETVYLRLGSTVDLYYRSEETFDFESYLEEIMQVDVPILYGKSVEEAHEAIKNAALVIGKEVFENNVSKENAKVYDQNPDYFESPKIKRGEKINIWYRAIEDFDEDIESPLYELDRYKEENENNEF